ncbi:MAG TPA: CBS domain-containing protein [bacterium]|jgi:CBS domain-containing protein
MVAKTARDIMTTNVHTADRKEILFDVTTRMAQHNIGAVVVTKDDVPVGMFSERDLLKRVTYRDISLHSCHIGEVMTPKVSTCGPGESLDEINEKMKHYRHRHLVVMEDGKMVGIISVRDLVVAYAEQLADISAG